MIRYHVKHYRMLIRISSITETIIFDLKQKFSCVNFLVEITIKKLFFFPRAQPNHTDCIIYRSLIWWNVHGNGFGLNFKSVSKYIIFYFQSLRVYQVIIIMEPPLSTVIIRISIQPVITEIQQTSTYDEHITNDLL